ncbi:hypothetical protein QL285_075853 [Trifolium repens]|nr:hypothetical protein QL285_075853 [Trifolium repens]
MRGAEEEGNLRFLSSHLKYPIATFHTLESIIYFDFPISRHSRLAPSLDNKVRLHNLLVFRVAAAEHISQSLFEAVTVIVLLVVSVCINELSSHSELF